MASVIKDRARAAEITGAVGSSSRSPPSSWPPRIGGRHSRETCDSPGRRRRKRKRRRRGRGRRRKRKRRERSRRRRLKGKGRSPFCKLTEMPLSAHLAALTRNLNLILTLTHKTFLVRSKNQTSA